MLVDFEKKMYSEVDTTYIVVLYSILGTKLKIYFYLKLPSAIVIIKSDVQILIPYGLNNA